MNEAEYVNRFITNKMAIKLTYQPLCKPYRRNLFSFCQFLIAQSISKYEFYNWLENAIQIYKVEKTWRKKWPLQLQDLVPTDREKGITYG